MNMAKNRGIPGNSVAEAAAFTKALATEMALVHKFALTCDSWDEDEVDIVSIRIRFPEGEGSDFLMVVRAFVEGQPMVGFSGGATFKEALWSGMERLVRGSMRWKEDMHAK